MKWADSNVNSTRLEGYRRAIQNGFNKHNESLSGQYFNSDRV